MNEKSNSILLKHIVSRPLFFLITLILIGVGFILVETPNLHRIRASFIYRVIDSELLDKRTTGVSKAYRSAPPVFRKYANKLFAELGSSISTWEKGLALARIKRGTINNRPPKASSSAEQKLYDIVYEGKGCCSDYTEVYIGLCLAEGVPVREWGITPDELKGYGGHSTIEIFDNKKGAWGVIDPFVSAWPALKAHPCQSIGLLEYLSMPRDNIVWHPIVQEYYRTDLIKKFYEKKSLSIFIISGQDIFAPVSVTIPLPISQLFNIIRGKSFKFLIPKIDNNNDFVSGLWLLRLSIIGIVLVNIMFSIYFAIIILIRHVIRAKGHQ
jgi:hypothetical protein